MGSHFSGHKKTTDRGDDKIVAKEKELLFIKDHPDRMKRRSSATPLVPPIKEERILEDLCDTTDIEPDVPANAMGKRDVNKLLRKISVSEKFTTRFQNSDQFLQHVRRLSDPHAVVGTQVVSKRSSRFDSFLLYRM